MLARSLTATLVGVEAEGAAVDAHPATSSRLTVNGLSPDAARDAALRVRAALSLAEPRGATSAARLELTPPTPREGGDSYDLAFALAAVAAAGALPPGALLRRRFFAALNLRGELLPVRGAVAAAELSASAGDYELFVAPQNRLEANLPGGVRVVAAANLAEVIDHLHSHPGHTATADLADIDGQPVAKRALEIAAAGGHHLLLVGPPGTGKTMLARRLPGLLPPLSSAERLAVARIHSAAGLLSDRCLPSGRPFRAPHHTASLAALCGGATVGIRPGEVSLAHHGVLFLDEVTEFPRRSLEALTEPLSFSAVVLARALAQVTLPATFQLVAAANFDEHTNDRPRARIAPLTRFLELQASTRPSRRTDAPAGGADTATVAARVLVARARQSTRQGTITNAALLASDLAGMGLDPQGPLASVAAELHGAPLRAPALARVLRIARTIADLDGRRSVERPDLAEALAFAIVDDPAVGQGA